MTRWIAIAAVMVSACRPGPLPETPSPRTVDLKGYREDWFPTSSRDPLPLDRAILDDNEGEVRKLLEQGADPNARWSQSGDRLPLQDVFDSRRFGYRIADPTGMVRLLLEHGADPNAKWCPFESRGFEPGGCRSALAFTPLMSAAGAGLTEVVAMLLDAGADPAARTWNGESALGLATTEVGFELISRALFPDLATRDASALSWLRDDTVNPFWSDAALFSVAIDRAAWYRPPPPPPPPPPRKADPRDEALALSDYRTFEDHVLQRFRTLLRIGADPNQRSVDQRAHETPLGNAVRWGHLRAARLLLAAGADVNARECFQVGFDRNVMKPTYEPACTHDNGRTVLMSAAASGREEAAALLLEFSADRSLKDWAGRTALDYASTRGMKELLAAGR